MAIRELKPTELAEARAHGLADADVARQLRFYSTPPPFMRLVRACTRGDGIRVIERGNAEALASRYGDALGSRAAVCFVPASGAASRMFKVPLAFLHAGSPVTLEEVRGRSKQSKDAGELLEIIDGLERFAFYPELERLVKTRGLDPARLSPGDDLRPLLGALLEPDGMNYANLPKGLLAFHRYDAGARTPFEEHLVEAATYAKDSQGVCRLHFTVSQEHLDSFRGLASHVLDSYSARLGVRYEVGFSTQHPSTDSLAVTPEGEPFRCDDGSLLFRPGGHGALLENLAAIDADVVFVKNIDNVVPDHAKGDILLWRQALGTVLLETQQRVFEAAEALERSAPGAAAAAAALVAELGTDPAGADEEQLARWLDRPLRVCGMVVNTGEPGGGPFWVRLDGRATLQIVEASQVDGTDSAQKRILASASHFNPVDLACTLRDRAGRRYDLSRFVDDEAVFLVEKSKDGRPLRSLERPGLWNGGMARWNTVFVEVPASTFHPVKTVNALLSPAHQPPA